MTRVIHLGIFVGILFQFSLGQSQEVNLKQHFEDFKQEVLENLLKKMEDLSAKVQVLGSEMTTLKNNYGKLVAGNSSIQMSGSNLKGVRRAAISGSSKHLAEGIILGQSDGLVTVSLPSLQQSNVSSDPTRQVAFDPKSRKVYWLNEDFDIKRANLDGTDVEYLVRGSVWSFGLDSTTGNLYYRNRNGSSNDIRVCSLSGEKCSVLASYTGELYDIALYPSKGLMFFTTQTSLVRANMDGTDVKFILIQSGKMIRLDLDKSSDRVYWTEHEYRGDGGLIGSCDLNGQDVRLLFNTTARPKAVAYGGDNHVYFADDSACSLQSVNKDGGGSPQVVTTTTGQITDIELYGSESRENPCEGSACSHLCVLKLESFACLCPEGEQLAQDGTTCV